MPPKARSAIAADDPLTRAQRAVRWAQSELEASIRAALARNDFDLAGQLQGARADLHNAATVLDP